MKPRDISIDIIKFFAVLLIINSHADICYPKYSVLATGGAIGDALFLFCSGYTLFWGAVTRFDNWFKRRINRIYPSVFACLLFSGLLGSLSFADLDWWKIGGGEFVVFIMIYYILLYIVQKWFINQIPWIIFVASIVTLVAYCFFPYKLEVSSKGIYGISTYFRWIPYFIMMLLGAWLGHKTRTGQISIKTNWFDSLLLVICVALFYIIQILARQYAFIAPWQIVTVPFLVGIVYFFWRCCNADLFKRLYESKVGYCFIMIVGGLCLESYLIQYSVLTDKFNCMFPFNIPFIMILVLIVSYLCRCLARIISQTFRTEDYEWKKIFAI